jgi:hypothetical protein
MVLEFDQFLKWGLDSDECVGVRRLGEEIPHVATSIGRPRGLTCLI